MTESQSLDLETRKAITGLRKLLLNPGECHLFTREVEEVSHGFDTQERWLSDRYVMLRVTDSRVLTVPQEIADIDGDEWPDGMYKLSAGKGLIPLEGVYAPGTEGLLDMIETRTENWYQMHRTRWSMADDEAKKMLCYTELPLAPLMQGVGYNEPLAINEGIWTQLEEHWRSADGELCPDLRFEYAPGRPYRVSVSGVPVAYVASASFPHEMRAEATRMLEIY